MYAISEYIAWAISQIKFGISNTSPTVMMNGIMELLPIILIPFFILAALTITALVFSVRSYRTNKEILKKLDEKQG